MRHIAIATLIAITAANTAQAEPVNYRSEFTASLLGLPVGRSEFNTVIDDGTYAVKGTVKSAGLVNLFASAAGSVAVNGRIGRKSVEAQDFALAYQYGDDAQKTEIGFTDGSVARTLNEPKVKKKRDWIETTKADLRDTLDPLSAVLVKASGLRDVCSRTIRAYSGTMRADLELSFVRTIPFKTEGFKGDAVTCKAKFKPVSGYSKSTSQVAWMRDKGDIEVTFAPVEGTDLYAPVSAKIGTQIGAVRLWATRFEAVKGNPLEIDVK